MVDGPMPVYRYSAEGIERGARRARRQSMLTVGIALAAGIFIGTRGVPEEIRLPAVLVATVLFGAFLYWTQRRAALRVEQALRSTEFEIEGDQLTARNSAASATIHRCEVTKIRYLQDGILVIGKALHDSVRLRPEVEQFEDLTRRLEEWVPAETPRVRSSGSLTHLSGLLVLLSIGLLVAGLTVHNRVVAIPCCILEALLLVGCSVLVWRSKLISRKIKWMMLLPLMIAISLLNYAYTLWARVE